MDEKKYKKILHIIFGTIFYVSLVPIFILWIKGQVDRIPWIFVAVWNVSALIYYGTFKDKETMKKNAIPVGILFTLGFLATFNC